MEEDVGEWECSVNVVQVKRKKAILKEEFIFFKQEQTLYNDLRH